MIPYPKEPSPAPHRPRTPPASGLAGLPSSSRQQAMARLPAASHPVEDFDAFIHVTHLPTPSPTPLQRVTSPLVHLVRGLLPAKPRASDFQARAFQAQEHDVWRERLLREGEGIEGRVEKWRDEEKAVGCTRKAELERGRDDSERGIPKANKPVRRSRSPSRAARPSAQPTRARTKSTPSASATRPRSDLPEHFRAHDDHRAPCDDLPLREAGGHFHIESTSTDGPPSRHHHHTEPNFQQSYDLRDRTVTIRKRDLLTHPVDALREGRVRRGDGADDMFKSEDEDSESIRGAEITPYDFPSSRISRERPTGRPEPLSRAQRAITISASPSTELPASSSEPLTVASAGSGTESSTSEELYARLRKELGPEIDSCWFSFDRDGTIVVDDRNQRHRSPDNVDRDWIDVVQNNTVGRGVTLREISPTPSYVPPPPPARPQLRPALVRAHQDAPATRPAQKRHSSFIPPTFLVDNRLTSHLAYQSLHPAPPSPPPPPLTSSRRLTTPSPLRHSIHQLLEPDHDPFARAFSHPSHTHANLLSPDADEDEWEYIPLPAAPSARPLGPNASSMIGIGSLSLPTVEWEARGKWVSWRHRGDWVSWKKRKENGLGHGKERWKRRGEEWEYDY